MFRLTFRSPPRLRIFRRQRFPQHFRLLHQPSSETSELSSLKSDDLTVSYLTSYCGFTPAAALSVAKKLRLKTTDKADYFLFLLRSHGFTASQITEVVTKLPALLSSSPKSKIKLKLEFFLSVGFSTNAAAVLVSKNPVLLCSSLERKLTPNFNLLKTIVGSDEKAVKAVIRTGKLLVRNPETVLLPNLRILEELRVPRQRIIKLVAKFPIALMSSPKGFRERTDSLIELGFDPLKLTFIRGLVAICCVKRVHREKKLQFYRSLGWLDEDFALLFKKNPFCLFCSFEKIKQVTDFFVGKLKWNHSYLAARPILLDLSLDKTIIPRWKVVDILVSKGFVKRKNLLASSYLQISEQQFLDKYVFKYAEQVPEVVEAYKVKLETIVCKTVKNDCTTRVLGSYELHQFISNRY